MKATQSTRPVTDLTSTRVLAALLVRMEHGSATVDAQQYRSVVRRLSEALAAMQPGSALDAVLAEFPAASQLYENLQYRHAGLCRSPLDSALAAELQARQWIERARTAGLAS